MKIFGRRIDPATLEAGDELYQMAEVTLVASTKELRKIASFILDAADGIERMSEGYGHEHLSLKRKGFEDPPDIIVANPTPRP
jgi:hypothetical protein